MMNRLSQGMDALREAVSHGGVCKALVIGSGYGGAVAAQRLAERGIPVTLLERGLEHLSGEFPDGLGKAFGQLRTENPAAEEVMGNETALFDVRLGRGIHVLVGNALGGGSQINANVAIEPDPRVFDKRDEQQRRIWPEGIDYSALKPYVERARQGLGASPFPGGFSGADPDRPDFPALATPCKTLRLHELAQRMQATAPAGSHCDVDKAPCLTVRHASPDETLEREQGAEDKKPELPRGACVSCGECVAGCNFNAKLTLTHTYLSRAKKKKAQIYTGVTALSLRRVDEEWEVTCVATEDRKRHRQGGKVPTLVLRAEKVIVAAGALGSTELLLRSRSDELDFSDCLGQRLATNGDNLAVAYLTKALVNGIGQGAAGFARDAPNVGPTISGSIRVRDKADVRREVLIQDAAIPRALAGIFHELVTTAGMLTQLGSTSIRPTGEVGKRQPLDWAALQDASLAHTMTLLLMGHDPATGRIELCSETDRVRLWYPQRDTYRTAEVQEPYLKAIGGDFGLLLRNPVLEPLPRAVAGSLDGARPEGASFTVHPLGGCAMGADATCGVVDHAGRVFDPAAGPTAVHAGLYVMDGAVVPTSLGVNPLLTITALAERAVEAVLRDDFKAAPAAAPPDATAPDLPPMLDKKTVAHTPRHVPVRFTEVMRSRGGGGAVAGPGRGEPEAGFEWRRPGKQDFEAADVKLVLHLPLPSLNAFAADPMHIVLLPAPNAIVHGVPGNADAGFVVDKAAKRKKTRVTADQPPAAVRWAEMDVVGGSVRLLPTRKTTRLARYSALLRTAITWLVSRGAEDIWSAVRAFPRPQPEQRTPDGQPPERTGVLAGFFKLVRHASEERSMHYTVQLRQRDGRVDGVSHVLVGRKNVGYPAGWRAIAGLLASPHRLARTNVLLALSDMEVQVFDGQGAVVGRGRIGLDLIDMTRLHVAQIGLRGNTPDALITLAGYPLWMLRFLLKTRVWDFRLPDYPTHRPRELSAHAGKPPPPVPSAEHSEGTDWPESFPPLRVKDRERPGQWRSVLPEDPRAFKVDGPKEKIELSLIRYPAKPPTWTRREPEGTVQFKSILLLNGFAQSTLPLVAEELRREEGHCNLASWLYEHGFDVWMLEYRTSAILECSKQPCSLDDIAEHDIPAAVDEVLKQLRIDAGLDPSTKAQIHAFGHCVGGAALAMSLLGGHLRHEDDCSGKLASVVFSQMHMFLVGTASAQTRLGLSAIARDVLGIDYFRLSAAERQADAFEGLLDRVFASLPVEPKQECPHERFRFVPHGDTCTCKRLTGIVSRLVHHPSLLRETHEKLAAYYGRANTSLLVHGSRCVEHERLVNADGQNVYVTEENLKKYMGIPVALLHGTENALFDVESATRTLKQLERIHPELCAQKVIRPILAEDFGHFDCTIGAGDPMRKQVLKPLAEFLDHAWQYNQAPRPSKATPEPPLKLRVLAPRTGPLIGWTRRAPDRPGYLVRLWVEVDNGASDQAAQVLTRVEDGECRLWPIVRVPLADWSRPPADIAAWQAPQPAPRAHIAVAAADVFIADAQLAANNPIRVTVVSVHSHAPPRNGGDVMGDGGVTELRRSLGGRPYSSPHVLVDRQRMVGAAARTAGEPGTAIDRPLPTPRPDLPGPADPLGQVIKRRLADALICRLRAQEREDVDTARRANPLTASRIRRSLRPPEDARTGEVRIEPFALGASPDEPLHFVAASCRHPGLPFERTRASHTLREIDRRITQQEIRPQFMLMLGDQIYADATAGVADSPSPTEKVVAASRSAFNADGVRRITQRLPTYMAIDDHEIADNWSREHLDGTTDAYAAGSASLHAAGMACFAAYQWLHSPRNQNSDSFDYSFEAQGCSVFVLDGRSHRHTAPFDQRRICSEPQMEALQSWLGSQRKLLKIIACGSVIVPGLKAHEPLAGNAGGADNWQLAPAQRARLLRMIARSPSKRVVLISGDYHCAAVSSITFRKDGKTRRRAAAIVSPALYAPYPAINEHSKNVCTEETVDLGDGWTADISTEAWDGDGYAEVAIAPGATQAQITLRLLQWDRRRAPEWYTRQRSLPLGPARRT